MGTHIFKNQYCIILDKDDGHIIKAELISGKIETNHIVKRYTKISDIPPEEVFGFPEPEDILDNNLYNIYGKVKLGKTLL
jgi:hypothetical protein